VSVSRHFLLQAPQCPWSVRKRFSRDHCCRGRSKPCCRIVGSHTRWELTTWADFQLCLHRLLMSTGCKSSHNGFLHVSRSNGGLSISGCIGQLLCLTIFSTSLSVAATLLESGNSYRHQTSRIDEQWLCDHSVKFAVRRVVHPVLGHGAKFASTSLQCSSMWQVFIFIDFI